jgi:hypothetical protein
MHFNVLSCILREERRLRVFESGVFRGVFGVKRDGVTGEWRKLHKEELHDLCCSTAVVLRVIKSRKMRCAGLVETAEGERRVQGFGGENLKERNHCGDPRIDGMIIIRQISRKWGVGLWSGLSWLRIGTDGSPL